MSSEEFTHGIKTLTLSSWEMFSESLQGRNSYVWRGQRREDWPLLSAFDRSFAADAPFSALTSSHPRTTVPPSDLSITIPPPVPRRTGAGRP